MLELYEFNCPKCGGNKLTYEKWVQSTEDVIIHENGHIEYSEAIINPDSELGSCDAFRCRSCGHLLSYFGSIISNEHDLTAYLMLTQEERDDDEQTYRQMVQEQIEREISCDFISN